MKILKPGKVDLRKFVCPRCRCLFVASCYETKLGDGRWACCPHCGKTNKWIDGEPYEEPTPTGEMEYLLSRGVIFREA